MPPCAAIFPKCRDVSQRVYTFGKNTPLPPKRGFTPQRPDSVFQNDREDNHKSKNAPEKERACYAMEDGIKDRLYC